jgi:hypothetical protein
MYNILRSARCIQRYDSISHQLLAELVVAIATDGEVVGGNNRGSDVISPSFGRIEETGTRVIIAGHGRFGMTVGRMLQASGIRAVVLDRDDGRTNGGAAQVRLVGLCAVRHSKDFQFCVDC